jgi:Skp family chaperone for outer membrane proteins
MKFDMCMKRCALISISLFIVGLLSLPSFASDLKAAKISLPEVFKQSLRVKNVEEEVRTIQMASEAKTAPLKEALTKIQEQLTAGKDSLKPEEKTKLQNEMKDKSQELQQEQKNFETQVSFKQKSVQNVMIGQIRDIITKLAKEEGYSVVFHSQTLLYSDGITDLTAKVAKELDALPALESPKQ